MGRIRTVKPELIASAKFAGLSDAAARLYYGLLGLVDDEGHCPGGVAFLAGNVFHGKSRSLAAIGKILAELEAARFVVRYEVEEQTYLEIPTFRGAARNAPPGFEAKETHLTQFIQKPQKPHFPLPSWFGYRNGSGSGSTTDPNSEQRPASGEAELDRELAAAAEGSAATAPGRLSAWRPPPGELAERMAQKRIAAGEITREDVDRGIETFVEKGLHKAPNADARLAKWLEKQRPGTARGLRVKTEPATDAEYAEEPWARS